MWLGGGLAGRTVDRLLIGWAGAGWRREDLRVRLVIRRAEGGRHEWIMVSMLPKLMERPDKAFWIDAMRSIRRKIEGEFKATHQKWWFHEDLRRAYREGMSLDEYLAAIAEVARKWGVEFP